MKRKILDFMLTACCMAFSFLGLVVCDNELDIRQEYPFAVETMPVADEITDGEMGNLAGNQAGRELCRNRLYAKVFPAGR